MSKPVGSEFQLVTQYKDLDSFAGKVVAVDSESYYFTGTYLRAPKEFFKTSTVSGYTFSDIPYAFARVSKFTDIVQGGTAYQLHQLLKIDGIGGAAFVNRLTLQEKQSLKVRLATEDELKKIEAVVSKKLARFCDCFAYFDKEDEQKNPPKTSDKGIKV